MPIEIKRHISIHTCDGKKVWHVPEECIVAAQGTKYIKLPRRHHGFARLVMHGCPSSILSCSSWKNYYKQLGNGKKLEIQKHCRIELKIPS